MNVSVNQFWVFLSCVSFGVFCGVLYSLVLFIKKHVKMYFVKVIIDVTFFISAGFLYILYSYFFNYPSLRFYMILGVISGGVLYIKSFALILAKVLKKLYNITNKNKGKKYDGIKV